MDRSILHNNSSHCTVSIYVSMVAIAINCTLYTIIYRRIDCVYYVVCNLQSLWCIYVAIIIMIIILWYYDEITFSKQSCNIKLLQCTEMQ